MLDNIAFKVSPWDPCYTEGLRMIPSWIRTRGFPMKFWKWEEFEGIFADFGAMVLELDPATRFKRDWSFARVRVGLCDPLLISAVHWVMHRDAHGFLSRFDLIFELDHQTDTGSGPWVSKKPPRDPPKRKPPGGNNGISISDNTTHRTNSQPPLASGQGSQIDTGKGKALAPPEETDNQFSDSDGEDDLPPLPPSSGVALGPRHSSSQNLEIGSSFGLLAPTPTFHPSYPSYLRSFPAARCPSSYAPWQPGEEIVQAEMEINEHTPQPASGSGIPAADASADTSADSEYLGMLPDMHMDNRQDLVSTPH